MAGAVDGATTSGSLCASWPSGTAWPRTCGKSDRPSWSLSLMTTARYTVFSSWRMLPGQSSCARWATASPLMPVMVRFSSAAKRARKCRNRCGMFAPHPQAADRQRQHVQPVEQVFAERAVLHEVEQLAVGRGNDADVDLHRLAAADRLDGAFLQRAQQLYLRRQRQLADLVEKQRAAGGFDELAHVAFGGAGEGAFS